MVCIGVGRVHLNVRAIFMLRLSGHMMVSGAFLSLGITRAKITHAQFTHAQSLAHIHILQIINAGQKIAL